MILEHFFTYEKRIILVYAGNEVITARFEDNNLLFTVTIRDDFGQRIFQIIDNELTINTKMYDVENSKNKFIIRNDERIVLEVELITPATIKINRLFLRNGWNFFEIKHGDWIINGNRLSNLYSAYAGGAMFIIG